jgi:hypothetical protein
MFAFETAAAPAPKPATPAARTEAYLAAAVAAAPAHPTDLTLFLNDIPKGADLHHHLTGAVYVCGVRPALYRDPALDERA